MNEIQVGNSGVGQLLSFIILQYLSKLHSICVVWNTATPNFNDSLNEMLRTANQFDSTADAPNFYLIMLQSIPDYAAESEDIAAFEDDLGTAIDLGCQAFIVSTDMSVPFLNAYTNVIFGCEQRYSRNHFVFVTENRVDATDDILNHPISYELPNILIITAATDGGYRFVTNRYVGRTNNTQPLVLGEYNESDDLGRDAYDGLVNLFPNKLMDLQGRVVRVALFNYKPYTVWKEVPAGEGNANAQHTDVERTLAIDGTESLVMLEFCAKHNCTLEISLDEAGEWGEIWDNRSGTGVLGAVAERRADVGVSALYEWYHEYQFLDFSRPIARTGITCIVPKPQLLSGLYLPAMPFSWQLWAGVFVSLLLGALSLIVIELVNQRKHIHDRDATIIPEVDSAEIIFQMVAIYLFQSSNLMSKPVSERVILCCVLLIALMIGNAYSGGLASIMTVPQYEPPIDNAHQLAAHNIEWGATQDAWIYSILLATQPDIVKLLHNFHPTPSEVLHRRTKTRDFAFSIERLPYGSFAIGEYIDEESMEYLQLMHHDIYYEYSLAMTSKSWALKINLDTLIANVVQSGIQSYWEFQVVMKYSDNKVQLGVATSRSKHQQAGPDPLNISRLMGVFVIWVIGVAVALLVFVIEFIVALKVANVSANPRQ